MVDKTGKFRIEFNAETLKQRIAASTLVLVLVGSVVGGIGVVAVQPASAQTQDDPCRTSEGSGEYVFSVTTENGTETFCADIHLDDDENSTDNGSTSSSISSVNSSSSTSFANSTEQNVTVTDVETGDSTSTNTTTNNSTSDNISVIMPGNDTVPDNAAGELIDTPATDADIRNGSDESSRTDSTPNEPTDPNADDERNQTVAVDSSDTVGSSTTNDNGRIATESRNTPSSPNANAQLTEKGDLDLGIVAALIILIALIATALLAGRYS